jgi:type I restriction enzyme S subunit
MSNLREPATHSLMGRFRRYPGYRDSGVEWLGEVPVHWKLMRLKWTISGCFNGIWGDEADGGPDDLICVRVADFDRVGFRVNLEQPTLRSVTDRERKFRLLHHDDLLIEKSGGGDLQPVGAVVQYDQDATAVCSNFVARMPVQSGNDTRFLAYFHAHLYRGRVNERSIKQTTGIQNLDSGSYLSELIGSPPLAEQQTIAAFLDRETARIDALIEKKRRFIELLQEKRAALISHAVTRGLDPTVPLKDSGIEWLGQIPAHWSTSHDTYRPVGR